jgi:hypothetical protein
MVPVSLFGKSSGGWAATLSRKKALDDGAGELPPPALLGL